MRKSDIVSRLPDEPELFALYRFWEGARWGRRMPSREDFDFSDIQRWIDNVNLVEVERSPLRFRYVMFGSSIAQSIGRDLTGRCVDDAPPSLAETLQQLYAAVVRTKGPMLNRQDTLQEHTEWRHIRLLLPLSDNDETVNFVLSAIYSKPLAKRQFGLIRTSE